jgi:hypothetical protein
VVDMSFRVTDHLSRLAQFIRAMVATDHHLASRLLPEKQRWAHGYQGFRALSADCSDSKGLSAMSEAAEEMDT